MSHYWSNGDSPVPGLLNTGGMAGGLSKNTGNTMKKTVLFTLILAVMTMGRFLPLWAGQEELKVCRGNLEYLANALRVYWDEKEHMFPASLHQLEGKWVTKIPMCPMGGRYEYTVTDEKKRYTLECRGWAHRDVIGKSQPIIISSHESFEILPEPTPPAALDREVRKVQIEKRISLFIEKIKEKPVITLAFLLVILFSLFLWLTRWRAKREKIRKIDELIS